MNTRPVTRPVFPAALTHAALEAAPYGDAFATLVAAEWKGRLELEAALGAAVDDARVVTGDDGLDHYL